MRSRSSLGLGAIAAFAPIALVLLGGCSSSSSNGGGAADAGTDASDSAIVSCENDSRVQTYAANLSKTSAQGTFVVVIRAADPAPPARDLNTWTVSVSSATSAVLPDSVGVDTFMPDHGHTSTVKPTITRQPDGTYKVENLDLFMSGVWRVRFSVPASAADAGSAPDTADFFFCIEG